MNDSIKNLFGFYRKIGTTNSVIIQNNPEFSVVTDEKGYWPQMVFDIDFNQQSGLKPEQTLALAIEKSGQKFAVCDASDFKSENQSFLRNSGIYPVKTWPLMEISPNANLVVREKQNPEFRELSEPDDLNEFCNMTNTLMMENLKISSGLIKDLAKCQGIKFYGLYFNKELASILLSFTENKISGLYFIATKTEYRGKKFAERLIRQVINLLITQKTNKVVLQAAQKAVPLYTRIGFKTRGELTIFWKNNTCSEK